MSRAVTFGWMAHLIFWVAYLSFKVYYEWLWVYPRYKELSGWEVFYTALLAQSFMLPAKVVFTYWVVYYFLPLRTGWAKKGFLFLSLFAFTLLVYRLSVVYLALPIAYQEVPEAQPVFGLYRLGAASIDILLVTGIASAVVLYVQQQQTEKQALALYQEKLSSELQFLKQQTQPHFLFNTLNNLYGLARKQDPATAPAILRLANMMNFLLYEAPKGQITLEQEVELIKQYVELEKLRYGERLHFQFDHPRQLQNVLIAPLLLLPLVENAFKHGASQREGNSSIKLELWETAPHWFFRVTNGVARQPDNTSRMGVGLTNLKRQLELQYPTHELILRTVPGCYIALLQLNPKEYEAPSVPRT